MWLFVLHLASLQGSSMLLQISVLHFFLRLDNIPFWRRAWLPTPVFLPGQRSLAGYSPRGRNESDMTERLALSLSILYGYITFYLFIHQLMDIYLFIHQLMDIYLFIHQLVDIGIMLLWTFMCKFLCEHVYLILSAKILCLSNFYTHILN